LTILVVLKLRTKGSYALVTYLNTTIAAPHQKDESGATFLYVNVPIPSYGLLTGGSILLNVCLMVLKAYFESEEQMTSGGSSFNSFKCTMRVEAQVYSPSRYSFDLELWGIAYEAYLDV
jgi:hypothetical protein